MAEEEKAKKQIRIIFIEDKIETCKEIKRRLAIDINRLSVDVINQFQTELETLLNKEKNSDNLNLAKEISNE